MPKQASSIGNRHITYIILERGDWLQPQLGHELSIKFSGVSHHIHGELLTTLPITS